MVTKEFLLKREQELITALAQLEQQYEWCKSRQLGDLCNAYTAGSSLLLNMLNEIQKMIKQA